MASTILTLTSPHFSSLAYNRSLRESCAEIRIFGCYNFLSLFYFFGKIRLNNYIPDIKPQVFDEKKMHPAKQPGVTAEMQRFTNIKYVAAKFHIHQQRTRWKLILFLVFNKITLVTYVYACLLDTA